MEMSKLGSFVLKPDAVISLRPWGGGGCLWEFRHPEAKVVHKSAAS